MLLKAAAGQRLAAAAWAGGLRTRRVEGGGLRCGRRVCHRGVLADRRPASRRCL